MVHRVSYQDRTGAKRFSSRYYAVVSVPGGKSARVAGFTSKRSTETLERNLERLVAIRASGDRPETSLQAYLDGQPERILRRLAKLNLLSAPEQEGRTRVLIAALDEFELHLSNKGDSPRHYKTQKARARRVLDELCGFTLLGDIQPESVLKVLARLRAGGLVATTSNGYRQACRAFTKWASRDGRLREDPLLYLERVRASPESNRRALTAEEQGRLVHSTRSQPSRGRLSGEARSVLYLLALQTGLRRGELLSLRRNHFDLKSVPAVVTIEHGQAKNRKTARLPLQAATADVLRGFLLSRLPMAPAFPGPKAGYRAAEVLMHDLAAAGIERETEAGRLDFHALRVTFVTNLAKTGVSLAQAQKLARHCDPKLTSSIYSRFGFNEEV